MLTPVLEKLILSGKAAFKTFVVGGTQKHILNVPNDRFIIITDLVYFSNMNAKNEENPRVAFHLSWDQMKAMNQILNTQLKIFSEKSNNSFVFRNSYTAFPHSGNTNPDFWVFPTQAPIKLDTYLIHENDVSFTFSVVGDFTDAGSGLSRTDVPAYPPPFDYGKEGQSGAEPVRQISEDNLTADTINFQGQADAYNPANSKSNLEFVSPVDASHSIPDVNSGFRYPLIHVCYVEIKGNPTNIEMTS